MKLLQIASGNFFSTYGGGQVYVKNIVDKSRFEVFVYSIFMSIFIDVKINI